MIAMPTVGFGGPTHTDDNAPALPAVGAKLLTAGRFVGNFAVALVLAVLLGNDADL